MPRRFLADADPPPAYPLGLIGPDDMDPAHAPFVRRHLNRLTWRLANVEVLAMGLRRRLSWSVLGGIEEAAKSYAFRYWYGVRVFREFTKTCGRSSTKCDPAFYTEARAFVAFTDGGQDATAHVAEAVATGKKVKVIRLPEEPER